VSKVVMRHDRTTALCPGVGEAAELLGWNARKPPRFLTEARRLD
jgi:hypothetical protein